MVQERFISLSYFHITHYQPLTTYISHTHTGNMWHTQQLQCHWPHKVQKVTFRVDALWIPRCQRPCYLARRVSISSPDSLSSWMARCYYVGPAPSSLPHDFPGPPTPIGIISCTRVLIAPSLSLYPVPSPSLYPVPSPSLYPVLLPSLYPVPLSTLHSHTVEDMWASLRTSLTPAAPARGWANEIDAQAHGLMAAVPLW